MKASSTKCFELIEATWGPAGFNEKDRGLYDVTKKV